MVRCLVCSKEATDNHHWPRTRRYGDATVPLCRECHTKAHVGLLTEDLIQKAPVYWQSIGVWEEVKGEFDTWMSRRDYLRSVSGV